MRRAEVVEGQAQKQQGDAQQEKPGEGPAALLPLRRPKVMAAASANEHLLYDLKAALRACFERRRRHEVLLVAHASGSGSRARRLPGRYEAGEPPRRPLPAPLFGIEPKTPAPHRRNESDRERTRRAWLPAPGTGRGEKGPGIWQESSGFKTNPL